MQGSQLKRSHKTNFSNTTTSVTRERSFVKPNKDPQKRRSQTLATMRGKPTMEIYRPPNVRTDLILHQNSSAKLNVHAKEFTMNHELQNSKSSTNLIRAFDGIPLQHSKSSGNILRTTNAQHGLIPIVSAPLALPLLQSAPGFPLFNHLSRVNFQMANETAPTPMYHNHHVPITFTGWNQQLPQITSQVKRSKSLGAADSIKFINSTKYKEFSNEELEMWQFSSEDKANLKLAIEDPNQLQSRTLMDLVKSIMEKVVGGIRYSEAGAKLCISIIEKEKNQTFIESLINTCQQWFQERDRILRGIKAGEGTRFTAFMWFLTEMCGQLKRHKHQCQHENLQPDLTLLSLLAKCCQACVCMPIKCLPEAECLFFVLTSIGRDLENELPTQLEQLLASVRDGFLDTSGSPAIRRTLLQLIELHASNWQLPGSSVLYYYPRIK